MNDDWNQRVLECALAYAAKGWRVLPLHSVNDGVCTCGKTNCTSPGKHPVTRNGVKDATSDEDTIAKWFGNGRALNVGICAGKESGLVVLDVDPAHGGDASVQRLNVPQTLEVTTGSGGRHFYFAYPKEGGVKNSVGKVGAGLDVRSDGGYVVAPPSLHVCGNEYRWKVDPRALLPAACPGWLLKQSSSGPDQRDARAKGDTGADDGPIREGKRNQTLASIAGAMRRQGYDAETIGETLISVNRRRCQPPLEYAELKKIAESISRYEPEPKNTVDGKTGQIVLMDDHADTIAEALVKDSDVRYRYNSIDGWSVCRDCRYRRVEDDNEVGVVVRRFLKKCRYMKRVGENEVLTKIRPTNARVRDIMGALAALEGVHIPPELHAPSSLTGVLDAANIIAMGNCLLDISGDEPKEIPLTEDYYTFSYMPFDYDSGAVCTGWTTFLGEIFTVKEDSAGWDEEREDFVGMYKKSPDAEAASILQEWVGYFVTSGTYLQKIFSIVGPRRSGKSTVGKVLRALVGADNTAAPTLTSLSSAFGLQPLLNKTLAIVGDAHLGGKTADVTVAVERLKSISGEDSQQINRKNKSHIQVDRLGVRFLIIANEMQDMRDSSGALASRFNFLITTESFLGSEDMGLEKKLLGELPGVFNWALEGLARFRRRGYIEEHPASKDSREDFELMSSPMTAFVNEWCEIGPGYSVPVDALWRAHGDWSKQNGRGDGFSKQKFTNKIRGVVPGIKKDRQRLDLSTLGLEYGVDSSGDDNRVHLYRGIDLKAEYKNRVDSVDTVDRGWTP